MKSAKIKAFLVGNLGAVFMIAFSGLVLTCAHLILINPQPADSHSVTFNPELDSVAFAFSFLVVGFVLQTVGFVREKALGRGLSWKTQ